MAGKPRSSRWPLAAAAAALALAALLATGYLLRDRLGWAAPAPTTAATAGSTRITTASIAAAEPTVEETAGETPSAEEIQRRVGELVEERSDSLGSTIEERYSSRLDTLRREVESARQESTRERPTPRTAEIADPAPSSPTRTSSPPPEPAPPPATERPLPAVTAAAPSQVNAGRTPATADLPRPSTPDPVPAPAGTATATPPAPLVETAEAPVSETAPRSSPPPSRTPAARPQESRPPEPAPVRPGDLVGPGPGVVAPTLIRHPRPAYPPAAQRLGRSATVKLRLLVDENGEVVEVEAAGPQVGLGFDAAALRAARGTLWQPAEKDGVKVRMWVDLSIAFRPE